MTIDAHQHFWNYDPTKHSWISEEMSVLRQDFLPKDLWPELQKSWIGGTIAVQADQSEEETEFLLSLAQEQEYIKGVVGWIDLTSTNAEERIATYAAKPKLVGFRHIVQDELDPNFMLRPAFLNNISLFGKYRLSYDLLVYPHQLGTALEVVRRLPHQLFILDHIAKPYIKDGFFDGWATLISAIAEYPNVFCKLSGMVTEADWQHWKYEDFEPYLDHVFEAFGTNRLLFGSDWPVCLLAGSYQDTKSIVDSYFAAFSETEKAKIYGQNALEAYRLR